jgi:predicted Zn-dependent peptidase
MESARNPVPAARNRGSDFVEISLAPGVRLWVLPDTRFKNVAVRGWLHRPLDERATETALLPAVLRRGCRRQPTQARMAAFLENLYGASCGADISKSGESHLLSFWLDVVNDRFVPRGGKVLGEGVRFLSRLLAQPVKQGKGLNRDYVTGEKENLRRHIEALLNDRGSYAYERCIRIMCEGEAFARYEYGRVEDLAAIDAASLAAFHQETLETAPAEIFVAGDVSPAAMEKLFRTAFPWKNRKPAPPPPAVIKAAPAAPREVVETMDVEQGHLVIGARSGVTWSDDGVFALVFANAVLGGFPHSKLFRNVREREGLAYGTGSSTDNAKGLVFLSAGIDPAKREPAVRVIKEQLDAVQQGDVSAEEMDKTRASLINRVRSREDSLSGKIAWFHELVTHGRRMTTAESIARYEGLSRDDVVAASRRVKLDTVYFLTRP